MRMRNQALHLLPTCLLLAVLTGCSQGHGDLRQWAAQQHQQMSPKIKQLEPPARYVPLDYAQSAAVGPFNIQRLMSVLRTETRVADKGAALIAAELNRRKEPLEAYPLDTMSMVGNLDRGSENVALVKVDQLLYQVRMGDYIGQNYGLVQKISEGGVELREIVQDAVGEWVERPAELQLQENKQ